MASAAPLDEYEGFGYTPGSSLFGQNGGSGWSGAWGTPGGLDATIDANSLNFGALSTSGGSAFTAGFQPPGQGASVATWVRALGTPLGADNTTSYLSFLFRPDAGAGFYGGLNFGGVFIGASGSQSFYGLEGSTINLSTTAVSPGDTVLFVLRVDFLNGNDTLSLFINPTPGQPQPALVDVLRTDIDLGTVSSVVINNYGGFTTDEIRIGSTFADVTPLASTVPEPAFGFGVGALALLSILRKRTN